MKNYSGQIALVLQGGGALGAYQVGVYEALHDAGVEPDWVIGTSIGAINGAIIAGNPPLGTQFIAAKPEAGLDWPVRLLVQQNDKGEVWAVYTDFGWIARRHGISGAAAKPFQTASGVISSITSSVKGN